MPLKRLPIGWPIKIQPKDQSVNADEAELKDLASRYTPKPYLSCTFH
jgi:hypothetical protein